MAVRAHRAKIRDWIYDVLATDVRKRPEVMDVDVPFDLRSVHGPEAEPAHAATSTVRLDALAAGLWVALVGVDQNPPDRPFDEPRRLDYFFRQKKLCQSSILASCLSFSLEKLDSIAGHIPGTTMRRPKQAAVQ
jgi:hypothetical protein